MYKYLIDKIVYICQQYSDILPSQIENGIKRKRSGVVLCFFVSFRVFKSIFYPTLCL